MSSWKINDNHWMVIIEFMEKHPSFARGQFSGPTGKITQRKLWEELTQKLNSLGYGEKTVEKWQKTWADLKYIIKKKATNIKKDMSQMGGGISIQPKLNQYEERIVAILGNSFTEGVGSIECGINSSSVSTITSTSKEYPRESYLEVMHSSTMASTSKEYCTTETDFTSDRSSNKLQRSEQMENISYEHCYSQKTKKKRKRCAEDRETELYEETIEELRSIKNVVTNICNELKKHNESLNTIKDYFINKNT